MVHTLMYETIDCTFWFKPFLLHTHGMWKTYGKGHDEKVVEGFHCIVFHTYFIEPSPHSLDREQTNLV